jgi:hypothetical protein
MLSGTRDSGRIGKGEIGILFKSNFSPELLSDCCDPATDHGNIGVGRADIRDETLPYRLPDQTESITLINRSVDEGILVYRCKDVREINVK